MPTVAKPRTHEMPFGKHRGVPIDELPNDYLMWALRAKILEPWLDTLAEEEFRDRVATGLLEPAPLPRDKEREGVLTPTQVSSLRKLSEAGHRGLVPHSSAEGTSFKALRTRGLAKGTRAEKGDGRTYITEYGMRWLCDNRMHKEN
jgi:hypothetical protein